LYILILRLKSSMRLPANMFLEKNALTNTHNEDNDYEVMIIIMIINKIHI
jgi:hypothetical protein